MELFKSRTRVAYTNAVGDKVYPVVVDIKKGIKSTEDIQFVSSDVNTGILSVAFISGNENFNVSGADVVCSVMRPDASTLELPCEVVRENIVEVPLGINGTSQDGVYSFDFKVLKGGNKVIGTPIMNYSVSLSIGNDMVVEEDDRLPVLTMLMTQLTELKGEARESINQANTATVASKEATAKAIEATNNMNATINTANQKMLEVDNAKNEMTATVTNKVNEVEGRFNALTASQQQSSEVIDARDGEVSLKARLDRDIEKAKQVYVNVEGSNISTDSSVGYAKDVEILGNTVQDTSNLADIRSVGDKVEGQELYEIPVLSVGKNLLPPFESWTLDGNVKLSGKNEVTQIQTTVYQDKIISPYINIDSSKSYVLSKLPASLDTYVYQLQLYEFDKNLQQIGSIRYIATPSFTVLDGRTKYIRLIFNTGESISGTYVFKDIQLEEGTQPTPYEPYVEDKITILSPVQLEKVGDVADRIIEKDGVWGVEKNVVDFSKISKVWSTRPNDSGLLTFECNISEPYGDVRGSKLQIICSKLLGKDYDTIYNNPSMEGIGVKYYNNNLVVRVNISSTKLISQDISGITKYLDDAILKSIYNTPQFIPLPHDQQVKLRTFANKTNISFLTEIEGTIKAQVPKSLGATVNTHTEQINNLNKELDRVKKLEESTVSTVTTESDFTTVEATSNGYFEDVKLEGKTLATVLTCSTNKNYAKWTPVDCVSYKAVEVGKVYTIIAQTNNTAHCGLKNRTSADYLLALAAAEEFICKTITFSKAEELVIVTDTEGIVNMELMILEGDHTQNPPRYFEGLKSVGDGVDEISVESCNGNYLNNDKFVEHIKNVASGVLDNQNKTITFEAQYAPNIHYKFNNLPNGSYNLVLKGYNTSTNNQLSNLKLIYTDGTSEVVGSFVDGYVVKQIDRNKTLSEIAGTWQTSSTVLYYDECYLIKSDNLDYIYKQDKKRLLYYNEETQAWEKPILRQWDSIEKHANGKYYYHQRSGEVVLNGSVDEKWVKNVNISNGNYAFMHLQGQQIKPSNSMSDFICDKLVVRNYNVASGECISKYTNGTELVIKVTASKLSTQDVNGFKQWLQANNVTVVYQLAQEKVYECTNIDLITYANETNYLVESGVLSPKTTLKVHNNISNVVSLLQKKVSLLESNVKASQEVQDMMILETDMRMLDIELALMEFAPMKLNLGGSNMLRSATYFNFLKNHIVNETYEKEYLENVMNKYLATGRINQDEYDELYKMLYPPVYDIELPIER